MSFTTTRMWRAKWYKRPWLWLIGKPTMTVDMYHNCRITNMSFSMDGELMESTFDFEFEREGNAN